MRLDIVWFINGKAEITGHICNRQILENEVCSLQRARFDPVRVAKHFIGCT